jgi:predicted amidohydrolase
MLLTKAINYHQMRICLAQTKPVKADVKANIAFHLRLIDLAIDNRAESIIFPELSITGYEPALANEFATKINDTRFNIFQTISDARNITIGIGVPLRIEQGITISLLLFQPNQARVAYSKQYLHPDEAPYFTRGQNTAGLIGKKADTALAICYELSVPEHAANAFQNGARIYIASVAKSGQGMGNATERLSQIAKEYAMTVLIANCIGLCDGMVCAGQSSAWNNRGELLGQLDDSRQGILLIDTATSEVVECYL